MTDNDGFHPTRRQMLGLMASAGVALATGCNDDSEPARRPARKAVSKSGSSSVVTSRWSSGQRYLVVLELAGGNDGLSTLVPHGNPRYHELRPTTSVPDDQLVDLGGGWALNSALSQVHADGLCIVDGIGSRRPSLSHFDMIARWADGTPDSATHSRTGFLGRMCDAIAEPGQLTGITISQLSSMMMAAHDGSTVALPDGRTLQPLKGSMSTSSASLERALAQFSDSIDAETLWEAGAHASKRMLEIDQLVAGLPIAPGYEVDGGPADSFVGQLELASRLVQADVGVRVIHIPVANCDFDTHDDHSARYPVLLNALATGVNRFRKDLADRGLSDRVLIATVSEFGRRARENAGGLDHGTSSCGLLMGPVNHGVYGDSPSLTDLDDTGNFRATIPFTNYLATLSSWLDVDPARVLGDGATPIDGLLA